jgi:hypothetical protein
VKYSKYFVAKRHGFIKIKSVLAPKGTIHLLNENIRYDIMTVNEWQILFMTDTNCSHAIHEKSLMKFSEKKSHLFNLGYLPIPCHPALVICSQMVISLCLD